MRPEDPPLDAIEADRSSFDGVMIMKAAMKLMLAAAVIAAAALSVASGGASATSTVVRAKMVAKSGLITRADPPKVMHGPRRRHIMLPISHKTFCAVRRANCAQQFPSTGHPTDHKKYLICVGPCQ